MSLAPIPSKTSSVKWQNSNFFFFFSPGCALGLEVRRPVLSRLLLTQGPHSAGAEQVMLLHPKDVVLLIFFKLPRADLALPWAPFPWTCLPGVGRLNSGQSNIFFPKHGTSTAASFSFLVDWNRWSLFYFLFTTEKAASSRKPLRHLGELDLAVSLKLVGVFCMSEKIICYMLFDGRK